MRAADNAAVTDSDHPVAVDDQRLGTVIRSLRRRRGWRQLDLAHRARLSRATVSRLERGHADTLSLRSLRSIAHALDVRVEVTPRWRGGELDRLLNGRHALLAANVADRLHARGWLAAPEVSFSIYGERGAMDLLAFQPLTGALLVVEVKTEIVDIGDLIASVDRKRRLAQRVALERGWHANGATSAWVAVADTRTNRRRLAAHRSLLRAAFPTDGRGIDGWCAAPAAPLAALSFLPDAHPGSVGQAQGGSRRVAGPRRNRR